MTKVLVIDDSLELLDLFSLLLNNNDYQTETAHCKNTGLDKVIAFKPDVVLLDVLLNGRDCRDLCLQIQRQNPHTSVILLSGDPELLKDYEQCNAFDVIEKPFKMKMVTQKIEAALH